MKIEKLLEYDRLATMHFELKKHFDKLKDKENSKKHKNLFEYYDQLAFNEVDKSKILS